MPAVFLMTEITRFLETLQGLQNKYELHYLFFSPECYEVFSFDVYREDPLQSGLLKGDQGVSPLASQPPWEDIFVFTANEIVGEK